MVAMRAGTLRPGGSSAPSTATTKRASEEIVSSILLNEPPAEREAVVARLDGWFDRHLG